MIPAWKEKERFNNQSQKHRDTSQIADTALGEINWMDWVIKTMGSRVGAV
jgi:hypothetical protein